MSTDQHEPTTNQQPSQPAPAGATAAPAPATQPAKKRRPGWRTITIAVLVLALAGWWVVGRFNQPNAAAPAPAGSAPPATGDTAAQAAESVAVTYESKRLQGDIRGTCQLALDPGSCRASFGGAAVKEALSQPVTAVSTEALTSPAGAVSPSAYHAVLVRFTITGQQPRLVALLITDSTPHLMADREPVGQDQANETLAQIFAGKLQ